MREIIVSPRSKKYMKENRDVDFRQSLYRQIGERARKTIASRRLQDRMEA